MPEPKDLNITLNAAEDGSTATLLIGTAPTTPNVREKLKVDITTSLPGPQEFFTRLLTEFKENVKKVAVVTVGSDNLSLTLQVSPSDYLGAVVTGKLIPNPEIDAFGINKSNRKFTSKSLVEVMRDNVHNLVTDKKTFRDFTQKMKNLNFKLTKEVEASDDEKGNVTDNFVQTLSIEDMPKSLTFHAPLFLGEEAVEFEAEIGIEANGNGLVFYLFSTDFGLLQRKAAEDIMKKQIEFFKKEGICLVYSVS